MHHKRDSISPLILPFDLNRMKAAMASGPAIRIPEVLSRDALRAFVIESNKGKNN